MSNATRTALKAKVSEIVLENAEDGTVTLWHGMSSMPPRKVTEHEAITRLWGYTYGVTVGIASRDFGDLPADEMTDLVLGVANEVFREGPLVDLEFVRLLENGRIDEAHMSPETVAAIDAALTEIERVS